MWADSFFDGIVNSLQERANKPFLNKLEMNNADAAMVIAKLRSANYYPLYKKIYGEANNTDLAFEHLADAVATFEQSLQVNTSFGECPHPSRARLFLRQVPGKDITPQQCPGYRLCQFEFQG